MRAVVVTCICIVYSAAWAFSECGVLSTVVSPFNTQGSFLLLCRTSTSSGAFWMPLTSCGAKSYCSFQQKHSSCSQWWHTQVRILSTTPRPPSAYGGKSRLPPSFVHTSSDTHRAMISAALREAAYMASNAHFHLLHYHNFYLMCDCRADTLVAHEIAERRSFWGGVQHQTDAQRKISLASTYGELLKLK